MVDGHELAMALRTAYLALHRRADAALSRYGVTADQFVVLAALANGDAVTQRDLARRTASDPNTIRAMLLLLENRRFIARRRRATDARARTVTLTAKGRRVYQTVWVAGEPVREDLLAALGPAEAEALLGQLKNIARAMRCTDAGIERAEAGSEPH
jgi:DNA-binding MarR family transcriptional regulator